MKMSIYDTQGSFYKTNQINSSAAFVLKPELLRPLTPLSTQFFTKKIKNVECGTILKEIPKFFHTDKIPIEELDCLIISEDSTNIMNTHTTVNIIL